MKHKWVILVRTGDARFSVAQQFARLERVHVFCRLASGLAAFAVKLQAFNGMLGA